MLVTQQPLLRRFWYPVMPVALLEAGPQPFTLLGVELVIWRNADGEVSVLRDRCPHRHAMLSKGWVEGDDLLCGYHGWSFNSEGGCTRVPQKEDGDSGRICVRRFPSAVRYGYVWAALEQPMAALPQIEEDGAEGFRRIYEFYEPWKCSGLRLMENSFDNAHFSFVHKNTFGKLESPKPSKMELEPFADGYGFTMRTVVPVRNNRLGQIATGIAEAETVRNNTGIWWMPFCRILRMRYPNGLVHTIFTAATPIDDATSQIVQIAYRNDTEAQTKAADIIAFDRAVVTEDRAILESTTFDTPVDMSRRDELHMASDEPGLLMRRQLMAKFHEFGEAEKHGWSDREAYPSLEAARGIPPVATSVTY
jgi:phenylpropionate dioxygenase-like ring-hydroxylating dioxygenase large terminal subunit